MLSQTAEDEAQIAKTINQLEELCINYLELERILERPLTRNYPPVYNYGRMKTEQAAEGLTIAERNRLGLGDSLYASQCIGEILQAIPREITVAAYVVKKEALYVRGGLM